MSTRATSYQYSFTMLLTSPWFPLANHRILVPNAFPPYPRRIINHFWTGKYSKLLRSSFLLENTSNNLTAGQYSISSWRNQDVLSPSVSRQGLFPAWETISDLWEHHRNSACNNSCSRTCPPKPWDDRIFVQIQQHHFRSKEQTSQQGWVLTSIFSAFSEANKDVVYFHFFFSKFQQSW